MAHSSLDEARHQHGRLISALAEYRAAGEDSDVVLGAFGLALTYDLSIHAGVMSVTAILRHEDGAWISATTSQDGDGPERIADVVRLARLLVAGTLP